MRIQILSHLKHSYQITSKATANACRPDVIIQHKMAEDQKRRELIEGGI